MQTNYCVYQSRKILFKKEPSTSWVRLELSLLSCHEMGAMEIVYLNMSQSLLKISLGKQIALRETWTYIKPIFIYFYKWANIDIDL